MKYMYKFGHNKLPEKVGFLRTKDINLDVPYKPKAGVECIFVQISKNRGIKIFSRDVDAEDSMKRQNKMSKKSLAPKTFGKVRPILVHRRSYFPEWVFYRTSWRGFIIGYFYETELAFPNDRKYWAKGNYDRIQQLCKKAEKVLKEDSWDASEDNVGWVKDEPVLIDFGCESWS